LYIIITSLTPIKIIKL